MATFYFLSGYPANTAPDYPAQNRVQVNPLGDTAFVNPAYFFYAPFPALDLPPISSNVPVLLRSFGWINGG